MTIQRLPLEIIQKIFEYTDPKEADQCLYLCKAWYPVLRSVYFKEITWSKNGLKKLKEKLSKIIETANSLKLMPMTKQIKIYNDIDSDGGETDIFDDEGNWIDSVWTSLTTQLSEREFILLLSHFPNLERLDFERSTHTNHYTKILVNYEGLARFPPLKDIRILHATDLDLCRVNFALFYRFRKSLKTLTNVYFEDLDDGSSLLNYLLDFASLESLIVENYSDTSLTLFHLLRACPHVASITYKCRLPTSVDAAEESEMLQESKEEISRLNNLKHIKLTLPTITTAYMDFFANHSPHSLTSIELKTTQTTLYTWTDIVSKNAALKFCRSLQRYSSVKMKFINYDRYDRDEPVVDEASRAVQREDSNIDIFYHILDALAQGRGLNVNRAIFNSRSVASEVLNINNDHGITYQYDVDSEGHSERGVSFQDCTLPIPSSSSTLSQLAQLEKLLIQTGVGGFKCLPINFLNFVKSYCPKLKHFELRPQQCRFNFQAACRDPLKSSLENTTHVFIKGADFSQALFDGVNEYFPRVKSLEFGISTNPYEPVADLVFNFSNFKHLETFIINIEERSVNAGDLIFIEFQYTGSNSKMQYLVKKVTGVPGCNGGCFEFQFVSNYFLEEKLNTGGTKRAYIIHVEGMPQLKGIQIKNLDSSASTLDLSHMLKESCLYTK